MATNILFFDSTKNNTAAISDWWGIKTWKADIKKYMHDYRPHIIKALNISEMPINTANLLKNWYETRANNLARLSEIVSGYFANILISIPVKPLVHIEREWVWICLIDIEKLPWNIIKKTDMMKRWFILVYERALIKYNGDDFKINKSFFKCLT